MFQSRVALVYLKLLLKITFNNFNIVGNARERLLFFKVREPNQRESKFLTMIISIFGYN